MKQLEKENTECIGIEETIWNLLIEYGMYSETDRYSVDVDNISYADFQNRGRELGIYQDVILDYYLAYESLRIRLKKAKEFKLKEFKSQIIEVFM